MIGNMNLSSQKCRPPTHQATCSWKSSTVLYGCSPEDPIWFY
ncbi:MAG: hypothetical protein R2789_02045 [Microthrixaceae bacterium]